MSRSTWYSSHSLGCGSRAGGRGTCSAASRHSRPFSQASTASPAAYLRARVLGFRVFRAMCTGSGLRAVGGMAAMAQQASQRSSHRAARGVPASERQPPAGHCDLGVAVAAAAAVQTNTAEQPYVCILMLLPYRMGSCSWTSRKVRPLAAAPAGPPPLASLAPSARSCCSSFRLSERPVPSYLARSDKGKTEALQKLPSGQLLWDVAQRCCHLCGFSNSARLQTYCCVVADVMVAGEPSRLPDGLLSSGHILTHHGI